MSGPDRDRGNQDARLLDQSTCWFFVLAHPGHELRAYHLMERVRPAVCVLTDGSGSDHSPRLDGSRALLARTGARPGALFGPLSDRQAYAALMAASDEPFEQYVDTLADLFVTAGKAAVLVDAAEGYNPVHDLCHWMGTAAARRARDAGAAIDLFEVDLVGHPEAAGPVLRLDLDDEAFARKLDATLGYDALKSEVESAFARYGREAFRTECLRRVNDAALPASSWVPYYEEVGNARVREGRYSEVLRYGAHVRPVIERLLESVRPAEYATSLGTPDQ
jgi:hypothetical protein